MRLWNSKKIAKLAKKNFERAWEETAELIPSQGLGASYEGVSQGKPHLLFDTIQKLREAYLGLGFEEVVNPIFIEDKEVKRQFGPEALAVLDRCFYLAGLPRPDVGLSDEKLAMLRSLGVEVKDREMLQSLLHGYKKGEFGGDDLIYRLAEALDIDDALATKVLEEVFPEFRELKPEATTLTLRSHMTSGWFLTLAALYGRRRLPLKLFSIDRCFRREQQEDSTHLRSHFSASCIVMGERVSVDDGKAVARALLLRFGFTQFEFRPDEKRSKYYTPGTQTEVYAFHPKVGWVEVATFGIYSPVALSRYKIEVPVMNLGMGVERLAMVLSGSEDVRELVYPQFYAEWRLSDAELAEMLYLKRTPESEEGRRLAEAVAATARKKATSPSPCEFVAYEGKILGRRARVKLVEREPNAKLLGPAALNKVVVVEGNILGVPPGEEKGVERITYLEAIALLAAARIEEAAKAGKSSARVRVGMAKSLGDINLTLDEVARRYITAREKRIEVGGPVFITIEASLE
ncbi:O-phosphoserine--tRNA ligase [Candidatus Pyrohabitans sp.]